MYGDEAERNTPPHIRRLLLEYGGKTPTGLPMWRLVRAGDCKILCQGRVHHFPRVETLEVWMRPNRISNGRVLMPRYRDINPEYWILQKWFPPSVWGGAADWRAHRTEDADTPLFVQEYPSAGDYFMLAGPWPSVDAAGDVRVAINLYLKREMRKRTDVEGVIREHMAHEVHVREENLERMERECQRVEAITAETLKSVSTDAQLVRDRIAAEAGLTGHLGASEDWG